ncbi:MAG TPA: nucleotidyltransferase domain-containing protein [Rectinemataceae bacterium]|nr:nucleotidyltransferase domain-containing protein [Rectinemataceae bacterium]
MNDDERVLAAGAATMRAFCEKRAAEEEKLRIGRIAEARAALPSLVEEIRRIDPGIRTILLFGSLARGEPRNERFDIDLAVDSDNYLQLVSWALDQSFAVDVVCLEDLDPAFRASILEYGRVLYERAR